MRYTCDVLETPCHIISDIHLGIASKETERSFEKYLRSLNGKVRSLIINGDLFDFWFEWKTVLPRKGFRSLAELAALAEAGIKIVWVAGNHDCWGGEILKNDVGIHYQLDPWEGKIGPWKMRVEHADGLRDKEDRKYRLVRPIMRSPISIRLFSWLHPNWSTAIATTSSGASRNHGPRDGGRGLRDIGNRYIAEREDLDALVYGHSHVADLEKVNRKSGTYGIFANAGSWLEKPTFLNVLDDQIELRSWNGLNAESDCINVIDRPAKEQLTDS